MSKKSNISKADCKEALASAEESLMKVPDVVGLGVVRERTSGDYRVAVYVSAMPRDKGTQNRISKPLQVPGKGHEVAVEIREIGEIQPESKKA